ncbi:hypothetical protein ABTF07_20445, partial [Acinetobacter baumannii]
MSSVATKRGAKPAAAQKPATKKAVAAVGAKPKPQAKTKGVVDKPRAAAPKAMAKKSTTVRLATTKKITTKPAAKK